MKKRMRMVGMKVKVGKNEDYPTRAKYQWDIVVTARLKWSLEPAAVGNR